MKIVAVCLAALALIVPASLRAQSTPAVIERVLVRVNGEILTQSQLTQRQIETLRERNAQVRDPQALQDAALRAQLAEITPRILVDAVDELLLVQHAREMGLRFTEQQFNSAVQNIKDTNKLDDAGLAKGLAAEGITMAELRQNLEKAYLIRGVQSQEIGPRINPTQEEMRQYYAANKDAFVTAATMTLREIFIAVPSITMNGRDVVRPEDEQAVKTKVDGIRARVLAGEDFAALAKELSESATKANGGLIGPLNVADINPALLKLLEPVKTGDTLEPVRLPKGYQLLKVETRAEPTPEPYEVVRDRIEQRIREERIGGETQKLLERLRTQALIEWKDANFQQIYEAELKTRKTS